MAFNGVRSLWSSVTGSGSTTRPAAAPHGEHRYLPQDSVIISDRTRRANKLGEGSFAKVYRGEYNGKPCAVKVFKEDVLKKELTPDPGGTSELEMLSRMKHNNIVQMYGMWLDPHKDRAAVSIVMELCDESLYELIRKFKGKIWPQEKKLSLLQDIARGMVYLHDQNIVHGDLRSSNVLLCNLGDQMVAKLADFDMARLLDPDTQRHFTTMHTAEEYLPPEVFDHSEHKDPKKKWARLTPKVDVFCYGEIVLEMGCGAYPTPNRKYHGQEMRTELQRREKHMLKLKQSDKESLGSIIRKCLADAPEGRPSFTDILLDVEAHLHKYGERPDLERLQDKTAECEVLRAQILKMETDAKAECEALRSEAMKWEKDAKELHSTLHTLKEEFNSEKTSNQDLQLNLLMQKTKVEELQQQILDMSQRERDAAEKSLTMSTRLQSELQEARDDLKEKTQLTETRDAELKMLHKKLVDSEGQMKNEQQRKTADWKTLQDNYVKAVEEKDKLTRKLLQVQQDKDDLKETLEDDKSAAEKELDKTKREKDALREDLQAVHEALSKKTNEHAEVMKEVASLKEALEQKAVNIGELQSKSCDQEKLIQELNRDRLNVQQEVEQLKSQRDTFKQTLDEAQASLKTSKEHTASVEEQLDHFQKKLREKESANAKLLQSLNDKEGEMKEMKQQKAKLESSAKGQNDRITQLKTKADEMDVQLKKERQEWTLERNALQQQNAELKKNVSEMDEQLRRESSKWESESTALKLEVATGKEHAKIQVAKLEETQSSMAATTSQLEQAAAARKEMETELQHLREKCDHLEQKHQQTLAEKVEELNRTKRESEREMQALKETHATVIAANEKGLTEKSQDVARLQANLQAEEAKVQAVENTAQEKVKECDQIKKDLEEAEKTFERSVEALQKELEDTAKHSKTCESERDHLREEKKVWEKREADLKDSVKKLKETCTEMEQSRMELHAQLKELKAEKEAAKTQLKSDSKKMSSLQAENEAVRTQQKEDSKKMSSLQVALQTEKDKLCNAEKAMCQKEKEIKKCKADLQAEKDKVHTMEKAALQKDNDLDQCRTELKTLKAKKKHQENAVMTELQEKLHRAEDVRVKLLGEKEDQKKREAALHDTVKELEQQHSNLVRQLSEREDQRDSLQREKADLLHRNHQLAVEVQQQTDDKENVLKEKEEDLKQYRDVERKLHRLSGNHAKKMAESEKEMQRLKDQLEEARKKQLTVQAQEQEAPEEQHMDKEVTRLQEEISQLKEQLKALKEGKEQAKRHSEDLRLQNTELQRQQGEQCQLLTNEQGEKMKLMEEVAKFRAQESVLKQRGEQKQNELAEMAAKKDSLDAQLVTVNEEKRALLAAERELTSKMEETQKELERMTVIAEKRTEEKEKEFHECQQLQEELKTLKEGKEQAKRQSEDLQLQNTELQRENEDVRKQLLQAQDELAAQALASEASVHSVNEMKKRVEIAEQLQADQKNTIRRHLLDLQKRLEENKALEEHIHELNDKLEKTSKELNSVQKAHAEKEVQLATLDSAKRQSEADLHEKMEQLLLAQKRVDELDEHLQSMAAEKEEAMKQATMAEKHNAEMEEALHNVSTQLEEMTEQRHMLQSSCKAELDKKSGEAEELRAKCSELKTSLDGERARMNDMSLSMAALSADKSDLEERLAREEAAKNTLEEEAMKRQAELQTLYGSEKANRRTIQDLGDMLQKAEHVEELKNQLQEDCEHLNGVIADQKLVIEGQMAELGNCKASMADMGHSMEALSADKKILEDWLANEKRLRDEEVTKLTEECAQLKSALSAVGDQKQRLLNQLDEKSTLKSEADASNEALQNQVTTLERELQREKDEHANTRLHCERVEVKLQDTETELADKITENYVMEDGQLQLLRESKELQEQIASLQDAQSQLFDAKANLQSKLDEAQQELDSLQCLRDEEVTKLTEDCKKLKSTFEAVIIEKEAQLTVLQRALERKMESSLAMEEENRRLRDNQMDQKKIKRQRQMLKQGQAEVQKMLQEVKEEKVKQELEHTSEEQFKEAVETLRTASQEERVELAQKVERTAEKAVSTLAAANQKYMDAESRQLQTFVSQVKEDLAARATELEHTSQEKFKTAVETLRATNQEERVELAQKVERTAEKALSTFAAANQKYVDTESRQLQSFVSQVKEDLAARATELEHTSQEKFKTAVETLRSVSKEETTEMAQELHKAVQDHTTTTSEELAGTVSKTLESFISQAKKLHALSAAEKGEMLSKVWLLMQDLLRYHLLATFSPSNYLHSDSGHLVVAKKKLERVCDTDTIQPVCIGDLEAALEALPTALEKFAHTDFQGVVCLAIPYATFTDKVRLYRMCFCHTPAGFDDKGHLHPKTVVAIAHVVLKPSTSSKLKSCAEGLVYSPTWHCGRSKELQSCFTERELLPDELVPVLQQLELATTMELKKLLGSYSHELSKYVP